METKPFVVLTHIENLRLAISTLADMPSITEPILDHIVILVPGQVLRNLPSWIEDHLTVLPGGRHADGLTENKLIIFEDGVYIELIAFIDDVPLDKRSGHRWGQRAEGQIVDWAFTLISSGDNNPVEEFPEVQGRVLSARAGFTYSDPVPGGRITPGGTELRWAVSAPETSDEGGDDTALTLDGGELPFWCLDYTDRQLRVPFGDVENVRHPSGAVGVASVEIVVKGVDKANRLRKVYDAVGSEAAKLVAVAPAASGYNWKVRAPAPPGGTVEAKLVVRNWDEAAVSARDAAFEGVQINISLFTREIMGQIGGEIGRDRKLIIDLIPLEQIPT